MYSTTSNRIDSIESTPPADHNGRSRVLQITRSFMRRHYDVTLQNGEPLFHCDVSLFTPRKPDLTLHRGDSTQGPVVAVSNFMRLSGNYKLGLGDPEDISNIRWEDMTKELLHKSKYRLETTLACDPGRLHSERRVFLWKRTRSVGVEGETPFRLTSRNYKLVDEASGQVLAVFSGGGRPGGGGRIEIRVEYGQDFDHMVLISCLSLYEKTRRRRRRGAAGGDGGGS